MINNLVSAGLGLWQGADDVGVTSISDGEGADAEVFTAGCSEFDVVAVVVMDTGLGQHSVVLDFGFSKEGFKEFALVQLNSGTKLEPFRRHLHDKREAHQSTDYSIAFPIGIILLSHRNDSIWFQSSLHHAEKETVYFSVICFPNSAALTSSVGCCWR
jgi:hypothetical protein